MRLVVDKARARRITLTALFVAVALPPFILVALITLGLREVSEFFLAITESLEDFLDWLTQKLKKINTRIWEGRETNE